MARTVNYCGLYRQTVKHRAKFVQAWHGSAERMNALGSGFESGNIWPLEGSCKIRCS